MQGEWAAAGGRGRKSMGGGWKGAECNGKGESERWDGAVGG